MESESSGSLSTPTSEIPDEYSSRKRGREDLTKPPVAHKQRSQYWLNCKKRVRISSDGSKQSIATCNYCKTEIPITYGSTSGLKNHLVKRCALKPVKYVISNEVSFRAVEGKGFMKFVHELQQRFRLPNRRKVACMVYDLVLNEKAKMKLAINGQRDGLKELDASIKSIRNAVNFIHSSPSKLNKFREFAVLAKFASTSTVPMDMKTRWNATYKMLDVALKYRRVFERMVEEYVPFMNYFSEKSEKGKERVGPPNEEDWEDWCGRVGGDRNGVGVDSVLLFLLTRPCETSQEDDKEEAATAASSTLVSNGCIDYHGRVADKLTTGGWKASPFIIVNEVAERLAFFAVAVNMVLYLVGEMHQSLPDASTHVTDWIGAAFVLTLLGAFLADSYLGRFRTIIIFSCIYVLGMVLLTLSASIDSLRPPRCKAKPCPQATTGQNAFLFCALALIALGTGGIKPCVSSFGADQFDESDQGEAQMKYAFFNWFFFAINTGALLGITVMVYARVELGWGWGFGIPTMVMVVSIIIMVAGLFKYRYQKPMGSAFTRFAQVVVAAVRNHVRGVEVEREDDLYEVETRESDIFGARKLPHTKQYRFLDKAAARAAPAGRDPPPSRWRQCSVTQVEELKSFLRVVPVWASTIALAISFTQLSTFFILQATTMDRRFISFSIPPSSTPVFSAVNAVILVPLYELLAVPFLRARTGHPRGLSSLHRIAAGLFVSILAMLSAAAVEKRRRDHYSNYGDRRMSVFWLFPQCFLMGTAEVFAYVGQLEFFYDEATDGTRSLSSALFLSEFGIGSWLSTAVVKAVERGSGGVERGWLRNDLNSSRLDYFYWILVGINVVNFLVFLWVAGRYRRRDGGGGRRGGSAVEDESTALKLAGGVA
ncbi:protein NRT1/ PTR FAMILY 8.2-like [Andrographis paniculata]|uniref:protein NRT1/ PTR FAMILY 8.2-like n=1 Tax=Andrographis paniculata TaxID=175694 RepID=UPI0021E81773|nr:protein NRT1/ PTR FAMILY 8.2-like [Andrographis paniculata]